MTNEQRRKEDTSNLVLKTIIHVKEYWTAWSIIVALFGTIAWLFNAVGRIEMIPKLEARVQVVENKVNLIEEMQKDIREIRNAILNHRD